MDKIFNNDFKILHDKYILNLSISDEAIKRLITSIFYSNREPLKKKYDDLDAELKYLIKLLNEYTIDRKMALQIYKRLCNQYGLDLAYYESEYKDEKLEYIYQRDSHITIVLFLFNTYSLVLNDIVNTNSPAYFLQKAINIEEQLEEEGFGFGRELFLLFINYIFNILKNANLTKPRRNRLIKVMSTYKQLTNI